VSLSLLLPVTLRSLPLAAKSQSHPAPPSPIYCNSPSVPAVSRTSLGPRQSPLPSVEVFIYPCPFCIYCLVSFQSPSSKLVKLLLGSAPLRNCNPADVGNLTYCPRHSKSFLSITSGGAGEPLLHGRHTKNVVPFSLCWFHTVLPSRKG